MGIVLDIILVLILLISIFMGYKKGLVNVAFNILAFLMALIITFILYKPVTNLVIKNTDFDEKIAQIIVENGTIKEDGNVEERSGIEGYIDKYVKDTTINATNNTVESLSKIVAEKVVSIIVIILLFIVSRVLVILLKFLFNSLAELPIIKQCNEIGGLIYGVIRGVVVIYILLAIIFFIVSMNNSQFWTGLIDSSIITKMIYTNNLILKIIFK